MPKAVGIDLGTTNSVVAVLEAGEPAVIPNSEGARTTPSVVAFSKTGEVLVGEVAKRQAITNPDRTIRSAKRHMGTDWKIDIDGKAYNAQEISARILQKLKRDAESYLGQGVTQAVITVPAYFDDAQRQATREAGEIAGLEVLRIINEPTAAALAYGLDKEGESDQTILVFDLGGGTFDVSNLEIGEGVFEVKSTSGNTHLGGDDWDQRVIDWLVTTFKNTEGVDLGQDKMALQRLKEAAEKAKIELSAVQETSVNLPFITATSEGPKHLDYKLTRAKFQELTADLVDACKGPFEQAIKDAGLNKTLGKFQLVDLPPAPRGVPQIEVTFDIDANGIVHVSARDRATSKEQSITITGQSSLNRDDIERMVRDAEAHADEDRRRRDEAEVRNNADTLVYQTEKLLKEQGEKLVGDEKDRVESSLKELKDALAGSDVDAIKRATESLMTTSQGFAQRLYEQAAAEP